MVSFNLIPLDSKMYSLFIIIAVYLSSIIWHSAASFTPSESFSFRGEETRCRHTLSIKIDPPFSESTRGGHVNWEVLQPGLDREIEAMLVEPRDSKVISQELQTSRQNLQLSYQYFDTRGGAELEFLENVESMLYEIERLYVNKQITTVSKDVGKPRSVTFGVHSSRFYKTLQKVSDNVIKIKSGGEKNSNTDVANAYQYLETIVRENRLIYQKKRLLSVEKAIVQLLQAKKQKDKYSKSSNLDQLALLLSKKPDISKIEGVLGELAWDLVKAYNQPKNHKFMYNFEAFFVQQQKEIEDNKIEVILKYDKEDEIQAHFWSRLATRAMKQFIKSHHIENLMQIPDFKSRMFLKKVSDLRLMRDVPILLPERLKVAVDEIYKKLSTHQEEFGLFSDRHKARLFYHNEDSSVPASTFEHPQSANDDWGEDYSSEEDFMDWYNETLANPSQRDSDEDVTENTHEEIYEAFDPEELVDEKIQWGVDSFHSYMVAFRDSRKAEVVRAWITAAERVPQMKELIESRDTEHHYDIMLLKRTMPRGPWSWTLDMMFDLLILSETSVMATQAWKRTCEMVLEQLDHTQELGELLETEDAELQTDLKKCDLHFGLREVLMVDKFLARHFWYSITPHNDTTMKRFRQDILVDPTPQIADIQKLFIEKRRSRLQSARKFYITEEEEKARNGSFGNLIGEQVAKILSDLSLDKCVFAHGAFKLSDYGETLGEKSEEMFQNLRQKRFIVWEMNKDGMIGWRTGASINSAPPFPPQTSINFPQSPPPKAFRNGLGSSHAIERSSSMRLFHSPNLSPTRSPESSWVRQCTSTVPSRRFFGTPVASPQHQSLFGSPINEDRSVSKTSASRQGSPGPSFWGR